MTVESKSTGCPPNDASTVVIVTHLRRITSGESHPGPSSLVRASSVVSAWAARLVASSRGISVKAAMSSAKSA